MRCTQIIGLTQEAQVFLNENVAVIEERCPHCNGILLKFSDKFKQKVYDSAASVGMFDDGPELYEYELKSGAIVREKVQAAPWSSGPCIFLKLVDGEGKDLFVWSEEEIQRA